MNIPVNEIESRINNALIVAAHYGAVDGSRHKMWAIDQMVRALTNCPIITNRFIDYEGNPAEFESFGESDEYRKFVARYEDWDTGEAP